MNEVKPRKDPLPSQVNESQRSKTLRQGQVSIRINSDDIIINSEYNAVHILIKEVSRINVTLVLRPLLWYWKYHMILNRNSM